MVSAIAFDVPIRIIFIHNLVSWIQCVVLANPNIGNREGLHSYLKNNKDNYESILVLQLLNPVAQ